MVATPRINWKLRGFREIRRLESLKQLEYDYAKKGANAAGDGFLARAGDRPTRARAAVIAATIRARRRNARDHTLMGPVIDAMRAP
ncbi:hypothetical protein GV792_04665 [Nocardia cyriacigeorgica]|uniref:hypothetical protein n=1 Tax=Nocardia cyriacigeorgica TaxID=135487 RepID=UPI0013BC34DD|nr:hypothetical protein [Nocardia cyriacigeorgica]NEW49335.1 hypothetical protein [Nocardia cyriacigeorgica]